MALVYEKGQPGLVADWLLSSTQAAPTMVGNVMDASGEKVAFIGNVWHPTIRTGTISIRKIGFRPGSTSLNAASELRVSLQNVSQSAGPPYQPDGVQDEFYDFKTATTPVSPTSWNWTGNLSADRAVNLASDSAVDANSRRLAVVFEYNVFTAADTININCLSVSNTFTPMHGVGINTGSWALSASQAGAVAFECDDGSHAFMIEAPPTNGASSVSVASNGAIRRAGVKFRVPTIRTLDRVALVYTTPGSCDGRVVLYDSDGTTELRSISVDNDDYRTAAAASYADFPIEAVTLSANTDYRLVFVASTTTAAAVHYVDVVSAGLMDAFVLGQDAHWTQHDGTSWTETTTRRPVFGLGFGAYDNAASGGGMLVNPGMTGGIRG